MTDRVSVAGTTDLEIPLWLHKMAFDAYKKKGGKFGSAEQLAYTGGFHITELGAFLPDWRDRLKNGYRTSIE